MTAPVASLAAERLKRRRPDCERCSRRADGLPCVPHRLDALAHRLREAEDPDVLLVPAEDHRAVLADALAVIDGVTSECLSPAERNAR